MGYKAGWEYLKHEILLAAEQDPADCTCYGCGVLHSLK